jgi:hypothetical protein
MFLQGGKDHLNLAAYGPGSVVKARGGDEQNEKPGAGKINVGTFEIIIKFFLAGILSLKEFEEAGIGHQGPLNIQFAG